MNTSPRLTEDEIARMLDDIDRILYHADAAMRCSIRDTISRLIRERNEAIAEATKLRGLP